MKVEIVKTRVCRFFGEIRNAEKRLKAVYFIYNKMGKTIHILFIVGKFEIKID